MATHVFPHEDTAIHSLIVYSVLFHVLTRYDDNLFLFFVVGFNKSTKSSHQITYDPTRRVVVRGNLCLDYMHAFTCVCVIVQYVCLGCATVDEQLIAQFTHSPCHFVNCAHKHTQTHKCALLTPRHDFRLWLHDIYAIIHYIQACRAATHTHIHHQRPRESCVAGLFVGVIVAICIRNAVVIAASLGFGRRRRPSAASQASALPFYGLRTLYSM